MPRQARRAVAFFRRRENAATAPAPNRTTIEGSGTLVPELEPYELEPCELEPYELEPCELEPYELEPCELEPYELEPHLWP